MLVAAGVQSADGMNVTLIEQLMHVVGCYIFLEDMDIVGCLCDPFKGIPVKDALEVRTANAWLVGRCKHHLSHTFNEVFFSQGQFAELADDSFVTEKPSDASEIDSMVIPDCRMVGIMVRPRMDKVFCERLVADAVTDNCCMVHTHGFLP